MFDSRRDIQSAVQEFQSKVLKSWYFFKLIKRKNKPHCQSETKLFLVWCLFRQSSSERKLIIIEEFSRKRWNRRENGNKFQFQFPIQQGKLIAFRRKSLWKVRIYFSCAQKRDFSWATKMQHISVQQFYTEQIWHLQTNRTIRAYYGHSWDIKLHCEEIKCALSSLVLIPNTRGPLSAKVVHEILFFVFWIRNFCPLNVICSHCILERSVCFDSSSRRAGNCRVKQQKLECKTRENLPNQKNRENLPKLSGQKRDFTKNRLPRNQKMYPKIVAKDDQSNIFCKSFHINPAARNSSKWKQQKMCI